jgi:hypothetical protein
LFVVAAVVEGAPSELVERAETSFSPVFYATTELVRGDVHGPDLCDFDWLLLLLQAGKLPVGRVKSIIATFDDAVLVQSTIYPLGLTLVGSHSCDVRRLRQVAGELAVILTPLQTKAELLAAQQDV